MNIVLAQINVTVGDLRGNAQRILRAREEAGDVDLVVFPELCVVGYPPEDLILLPHFRAEAMKIVQELAAATKSGPAMLIGCVWEEDGTVYNAALLLDGGKIMRKQYKHELPNYGIFDEKRIFTPGPVPQVFTWRGKKLGVMICEDMWHAAVPEAVRGAEQFIVINASPFEARKLSYRMARASMVALEARAPLVYCNLVGGQDDIVFDGASFVVNADGALAAHARANEEDLLHLPAPLSEMQPDTEFMSAPRKLYGALVLALCDYVRKNNFKSVVLGLSGGVDSALVAAIAVDALGKEHVHGVLLPSPYTSKESIEDAHASAKLLGIKTTTIPIEDLMRSFVSSLREALATKQSSLDRHAPGGARDDGWMEDVSVGGNLQARIRANILMAISNASGAMLLNTGNKSEVATGYTTLYGDACGGFAPIKDVYKTQVWELAKWRNVQSPAIPERSIAKPPSAELKPGQLDQDQLPPYELLDRILEAMIEGHKAAEEIIAAGFERATVEKVFKLVRAAEYKRRQLPPGPKVSERQFIRDWRMPITCA